MDMGFVSLSSSPREDVCVGWTREKTMIKSAKLPAYNEQVLGHPLFFLRLPSNAFPDIGKANTHGKTKAILFLL